MKRLAIVTFSGFPFSDRIAAKHPRNRLKKLTTRAREQFGAIRRFSPAASIAFAVTLVCIVIAVVPYFFFPVVREDLGPGLFVEFGGAIFDLVIFGILIALFLEIRERRQQIKRYEEEIDDFKTWDSDEARHRIAGRPHCET